MQFTYALPAWAHRRAQCLVTCPLCRYFLAAPRRPRSNPDMNIGALTDLWLEWPGMRGVSVQAEG